MKQGGERSAVGFTPESKVGRKVIYETLFKVFEVL